MEEETSISVSISWPWKALIVCIALTLGLLTATLVPPPPKFAVTFVSGETATKDLKVGLTVTNPAAETISYDSISGAAFFAGGEPLTAASKLLPFAQSSGEVSSVWFRLQNSTLLLTPEAVASARIVVTAMASHGGGSEWPMTVVCDDVTVLVSRHDTWQRERVGLFECVVDGVWWGRERWMFVGVFVVPFLVYMLILYCLNFVSLGYSESVRDDCTCNC